jgi:hypothetical protein
MRRGTGTRGGGHHIAAGLVVTWPWPRCSPISYPPPGGALPVLMASIPDSEEVILSSARMQAHLRPRSHKATAVAARRLPRFTPLHQRYVRPTMITLLTRPPHHFRCARTTQSSSRAKCIASVAVHISPTMSQPSTLPPRRPLLSLRAQSPHPISSLALQVTIHGVHCMS